MGYTCNCGLISCQQCFSKALGVAQTATNTTNVIGVPGPTNYEYDLEMGYIPPDTTYAEYRASLKGEPGVNGTGIEIKGNLNSYAELLAIVDPQPGDSYAVKDASGDQSLLYTYGDNGWPAEGDGIPIQGEPGAPGADGNSYIPMNPNNYFDI